MSMSTRAETTGQRIRRLRKAARLTQVELARRIGVDHMTVSRWERNLITPGMLHCRLLAAALGGDILDFVEE